MDLQYRQTWVILTTWKTASRVLGSATSSEILARVSGGRLFMGLSSFRVMVTLLTALSREDWSFSNCSDIST